MIITIVTIVAVAATIFGYIAQMKKMNKWKYSSEEKDSINKILRAHMNNVESELKASANHIRILQSELQSLKDKAKSINQKPKSDLVAKPATQPKKNFKKSFKLALKNPVVNSEVLDLSKKSL